MQLSVLLERPNGPHPSTASLQAVSQAVRICSLLDCVTAAQAPLLCFEEGVGVRL